jgi:hypothetical protein
MGNQNCNRGPGVSSEDTQREVICPVRGILDVARGNIGREVHGTSMVANIRIYDQKDSQRDAIRKNNPHKLFRSFGAISVSQRRSA